jgi:hypothetical protein
MRTHIIATLGVLSLAALLTQIAAAPSFAAGQNTQTEQVMHQKLEHSAQLLAALVTSDWASLGRHGHELQELTTKPGWNVLRLPEFNKYTNAFQRATTALVTAADERDPRRALAAYNGLVASCVECHQYVARARIVGRPLGG